MQPITYNHLSEIFPTGRKTKKTVLIKLSAFYLPLMSQ
jgi:hypothetical protein